MAKEYISEQTYERINYTECLFPKAEYEFCNFINCDFSKADISNCVFSSCTFIDCNISLTKIIKTSFRETTFKNCKMLGLMFDTCNEFGLSFSFENCTLNHSTFYKTIIKNTVFNNCTLHEVDFTESNVSYSQFDSCDLQRALFDNTNIEHCDFRTAFNFSIHPEINKIKKAIFSSQNLTGLLNAYDLDIQRD